MKIIIFCMIPCSLVEVYRRFGGSCFLRLLLTTRSSEKAVNAHVLTDVTSQTMSSFCFISYFRHILNKQVLFPRIAAASVYY
jgi:hypothetical protein